MHRKPFFQTVSLLILVLLMVSCGGAPSPAAGFPSPTAVPSEPTITAPPTPILAPTPETPPATSLPEPTSAPPATSQPEPTPIPSPQPTVAPPPPTATPTPAPPTPVPPTSSFTGILFFLRDGALWIFDAGGERLIVDQVREFTPSANGNVIAVVREVERQFDVWTVRRDGSDLRRITNDRSVEASLSWSPDNAALIFAAADASEFLPQTWPDRALWCSAGQIVVLDIASGQRQALANGCDPALSPDGRRIAYSAPPTLRDPAIAGGAPVAGNAIRLINRRGENTWNFARADGADAPAPNTGMLVYAPAWSPDGASVAYHRYVGMQIEVDVNLSEIGGSFEGKGRPFAEGAGWLLPSRFAPDGRRTAIIEHNYSDARGFGGYDDWSVQVVALDGLRTVDLPQGSVTMLGGSATRLPRAASAAWSPDGTLLAVLLPPGWRPDVPLNEPFDPSGAESPGEVWLWQPGVAPSIRLISNVDFASPLAWLP
ncbi:PD40 domain-containing protein [Roseiflexus castenholzii]|nr:PD40 domain-containing protein [Roseiflexus castenholzii]